MSVPTTTRQAYAFLAPLMGKSTIFVTPNREGNASLARFVLGCLAVSGRRTIIYDTSSFYGTNIRALAEGLPDEYLERTRLLTVSESGRLEESLTELVIATTTTTKTEATTILIDDLNALHYLLSRRRQKKSSIQKLFTFIRVLSYHAARSSGRLSVFGTFYRNENAGLPPTERGPRRSILAAADLQVSTRSEASSSSSSTVANRRTSFQCDGLEGWPDGTFLSTAPYFEPRT